MPNPRFPVDITQLTRNQRWHLANLMRSYVSETMSELETEPDASTHDSIRAELKQIHGVATTLYSDTPPDGMTERHAILAARLLDGNASHYAQLAQADRELGNFMCEQIADSNAKAAGW